LENEKFQKNNWAWSKTLDESVKIIDKQSQWNFISYNVWSPSSNKVIPHKSTELDSINNAKYSKELLLYLIATARINQAYTTESILSPLEGNLIPLPHQLTALSKILKNPTRVRYLLSDEVGLGKTIEAGLVIKELKIRNDVKRVLVIVPRGLVYQWIYELKNRFNEEFTLIEPSDYNLFEDNYWTRYDQVITSIDSVKPLLIRKGWNQTKIDEYNQKRFHNLLLSRWDLIVVDESHKLSGTSTSVARFKLGKGLSEASPHMLLLSATPHQGNRKQFHRLVSFLEPKSFPNPNYISKESVLPITIRTEKRKAIDVDGNLLFTKRTTRLKKISWTKKYESQKILYERVSDYVLNGYNQAQKENRQYMGFLMILMQRLVTSSTKAIFFALEKRLAILNSKNQQKDADVDEDWTELDGQMQLDQIFEKILNPLNNEKETVQELLHLAQKCELEGPDAKTEFLLELLLKIQSEENVPKTKFLIFTEFTSTQKMLQEFLSTRGFDTVILNGSLNMQQRENAQNDFANKAQIMISTEAGGEGLNLQFCHNIVNYDLPWNPMRIEQRIGRVDRIGQKFPVKAFNFTIDGTVETRVMQVLESKLQTILDDIGVDKLSDVLDSAETDFDFNKLYVNSLEDPQNIENKVDIFLTSLKQKINMELNNRNILTSDQKLDHQIAKTIQNHPLPNWVEMMVLNYLKSKNSEIIEKNKGLTLKWPDGKIMSNVTFEKNQVESDKLKFLSLENPHVREISKYVGTFVNGQKIPKIKISALSSEIRGLWSLWRVGIIGNQKILNIFPIFIHQDGRKLKPTAFHIWDLILQKNSNIDLSEEILPKNNTELYEEVENVASDEGKTIFENLKNEYHNRLKNDEEKMNVFFEYQNSMIEKIGLENVRKKRLADLEHEKIKFGLEMKKLEEVFPEFKAITMLWVEGPK